MDAETIAVGGKEQGDDGEETQRGGCKKGAQGRGGKETCCCVQGEREKKLERARRAKATMEENPDALRKGKWPRCTQ